LHSHFDNVKKKNQSQPKKDNNNWHSTISLPSTSLLLLPTTKKNIKSKKKGKNKIEARPLKKENVADVLIRTKEEENLFANFCSPQTIIILLFPPPSPLSIENL
jgi:hypothetical protein